MAQEKAIFLHVLCARTTRNLHAIFAGTPQLDRVRGRIAQKAQDVVAGAGRTHKRAARDGTVGFAL